MYPNSPPQELDFIIYLHGGTQMLDLLSLFQQNS